MSCVQLRDAAAGPPHCIESEPVNYWSFVFIPQPVAGYINYMVPWFLPRKWPRQFVPQYICHISGPNQAGPLQPTELRPPGPLQQDHWKSECLPWWNSTALWPVLDSDSIYWQAAHQAQVMLLDCSATKAQDRRELRQTRISHRCKNVYLSTSFHPYQTRFSRTNMRHNPSDCAFVEGDPPHLTCQITRSPRAPQFLQIERTLQRCYGCLES